MKLKKLSIAIFALVFSASAASAAGTAKAKPAAKAAKAAKTQHSLIGKNEVSKETIGGTKLSFGSDYPPSQYPQAHYSLGSDGLYHFNPSRKR